MFKHVCKCSESVGVLSGGGALSASKQCNAATLSSHGDERLLSSDVAFRSGESTASIAWLCCKNIV